MIEIFFPFLNRELSPVQLIFYENGFTIGQSNFQDNINLLCCYKMIHLWMFLLNLIFKLRKLIIKHYDLWRLISIKKVLTIHNWKKNSIIHQCTEKMHRLFMLYVLIWYCYKPVVLKLGVIYSERVKLLFFGG